MDQGAPIDWIEAKELSKSGMLMGYLEKLPRHRWAERDEDGNTLFNWACSGPNMAAVVVLWQSGLVGANVRNKKGNTPAHRTASWVQPRVLEVLCAAGVQLRTCNNFGNPPIAWALQRGREKGRADVARVLLANGVRLGTVPADYRTLITLDLVEFERGVLRCRTAVLALIRVKRAGQLWQWDKFLLRELAYAVWATRYEEEEWQN